MFLTMYLDATTDAPEGPGWYMASYGHDGTEVLAKIRLSAEEAIMMGNLADRLSQGKILHTAPGAKQSTLDVTGSIVASSEQIKAAIQQQLDEAEAAARRIASLRRGLAEFDQPISTTQEHS